MKTGKLLITALVKPRSFIGVRSYSKISDPEKIRMEDIRITALRPNDYDDFEIFKKIITNEDVAFAVPRIDQCFDNKILRQKC